MDSRLRWRAVMVNDNRNTQNWPSENQAAQHQNPSETQLKAEQLAEIFNPVFSVPFRTTIDSVDEYIYGSLSHNMFLRCSLNDN